MSTTSPITKPGRIYDGDGDTLLAEQNVTEKLVIVPEGQSPSKPDTTPRVRIMWGQHLLDDLLAGRYRSLVCAVNTHNNAHGIIGQLAALLPASPWTAESITQHARQFVGRQQTTVLKYDFDTVECLALLRPTDRDTMTLDDLGQGLGVVREMLARRTDRLPVASVSFLGAHSNRLVDAEAGASAGAGEPSFEQVLRVMHEAGFTGDVYPAVWMWDSAPTALFARYPFPRSVDDMRAGGF